MSEETLTSKNRMPFAFFSDLCILMALKFTNEWKLIFELEKAEVNLMEIIHPRD